MVNSRSFFGGKMSREDRLEALDNPRAVESIIRSLHSNSFPRIDEDAELYFEKTKSLFEKDQGNVACDLILALTGEDWFEDFAFLFFEECFFGDAKNQWQSDISLPCWLYSKKVKWDNEGNDHRQHFLRILREYPKASKLKPELDTDSIKRLTVSHCPGLQTLDYFPGFSTLEYLDLSSCENLISLSGLEKFTALKELNLNQCENLSDLSALSNFSSLKIITLTGAHSVTDLSPLKKHSKVQKLYLGCPQVTNLDFLDELKDLENLSFSDGDFVKLSCSASMKRLKELTISELPKLNCLSIESKLSELRSIYVSECHSLEKLEGLDKAPFLDTLKLNSCSSFQKLQPVTTCSFWTNLQLTGTKISQLPPLELPKLLRLSLDWCENLETCPSLKSFPSLQSLNLNDCGSLRSLSDFSCNQKLQTINLRSCINLPSLHGMEGLNCLDFLDLENCDSLSDLSALKEIKWIRKIDLPNNDHGLSTMNFALHASEINIFGASELKSVPLGWGQRNLLRFEIREAEVLESLNFLENCEMLTALHISDGNSLKDLSVLKNCNHLKELHLNCNQLTEIAEVMETLSSLKTLNLSYTKIKDWEFLSKLVNLESLSLNHCENLISLDSLSQLEKLKSISLWGCISLKNADALSGLQLNHANLPDHLR